MSAATQEKRLKTAREVAENFNIHPRTVRKIIAEPREIYLARSRERMQKITELRAKGLKLKQISQTLDIPIGTVGTVLHRAKQRL